MYIDLLQIQRFSFLKFLQNGINQVFDNINPIIIANRKYVFFSKYYLLKIPSQIDFISINNQFEPFKVIEECSNSLSSTILESPPRVLQRSKPLADPTRGLISSLVSSNQASTMSSHIKYGSSRFNSNFSLSISNVKYAQWIQMNQIQAKKKQNNSKLWWSKKVIFDYQKPKDQDTAKKPESLGWFAFQTKSPGISNLLKKIKAKNPIKNNTFFFLKRNNDFLFKPTKNYWPQEEYELNHPKAPINSSLNLSKASHLTYASEFYIPVQIIDQITKKMYLRWVLLADLPIQTKRGHFIINGYPKTVIHQIVRSPGIRFKNEDNQILADIISMRGAWMGIQIVYEKNLKAATFALKRQNKITNKSTGVSGETPDFQRSFNNRRQLGDRFKSRSNVNQANRIGTQTSLKSLFNNKLLNNGLGLSLFSLKNGKTEVFSNRVNNEFSKVSKNSLPGKNFSQSNQYRYQASFIQDAIMKNSKSTFFPFSILSLLKAKHENMVFKQLKYWPQAFFNPMLIQSSQDSDLSLDCERKPGKKIFAFSMEEYYKNLFRNSNYHFWHYPFWTITEYENKMVSSSIMKSGLNNKSMKILTPNQFKFPLNSRKASEKIHEALSVNFFISSSRTDKTDKKKIKLSGFAFLDYLFDHRYFVYNNYVPSWHGSSFFPADTEAFSSFKKLLNFDSISNKTKNGFNDRTYRQSFAKQVNRIELVPDLPSTKAYQAIWPCLATVENFHTRFLNRYGKTNKTIADSLTHSWYPTGRYSSLFKPDNGFSFSQNLLVGFDPYQSFNQNTQTELLAKENYPPYFTTGNTLLKTLTWRFLKKIKQTRFPPICWNTVKKPGLIKSRMERYTFPFAYASLYKVYKPVCGSFLNNYGSEITNQFSSNFRISTQNKENNFFSSGLQFLETKNDQKADQREGTSGSVFLENINQNNDVGYFQSSGEEENFDNTNGKLSMIQNKALNGEGKTSIITNRYHKRRLETPKNLYEKYLRAIRRNSEIQRKKLFGEDSGDNRPPVLLKNLKLVPKIDNSVNTELKDEKTVSSNRLLASLVSILNSTNFRDVLYERFMNAKFYDIGLMGRKRLNKKLRLNVPLQCTTLTPLDFLAIFYKLFSLYNNFSLIQNFFPTEGKTPLTIPVLGDSFALNSKTLPWSNKSSKIKTLHSSGSIALRQLMSINLGGTTLPLAFPGVGRAFKPRNSLLDNTWKQTGSLDHLNQRHVRTSGEFLFLQFWRGVLRFYQVLSQLSNRSNFIKSSYTAAGKTGRNFFSLSTFSLFPSNEGRIDDQTAYILPISNHQSDVSKAYGYFNRINSRNNSFNFNSYQYQCFQNTLSGDFVVNANSTTFFPNKITGNAPNNFRRDTLNIVINRNDLNSILPYSPYFKTQQSLSPCAQFQHFFHKHYQQASLSIISSKSPFNTNSSDPNLSTKFTVDKRALMANPLEKFLMKKTLSAQNAQSTLVNGAYGHFFLPKKNGLFVIPDRHFQVEQKKHFSIFLYTQKHGRTRVLDKTRVPHMGKNTKSLPVSFSLIFLPKSTVTITKNRHTPRNPELVSEFKTVALNKEDYKLNPIEFRAFYYLPSQKLWLNEMKKSNFSTNTRPRARFRFLKWSPKSISIANSHSNDSFFLTRFISQKRLPNSFSSLNKPTVFNSKIETIIKKLLYETKELRVFDAKERMRNLETKLFNGVFKEFFNLDPLSQDLDETNGLSEIIHKRRISALGKGGVTSKNAPLSIRSIHPSFYGRLCPIDSPEGDRVGLINSLTNYARITKIGYIATPFYRTRNQDNLQPVRRIDQKYQEFPPSLLTNQYYQQNTLAPVFSKIENTEASSFLNRKNEEGPLFLRRGPIKSNKRNQILLLDQAPFNLSLLTKKNYLQMRVCPPIAFFGKIHDSNRVPKSVRLSFQDLIANSTTTKDTLKWKIYSQSHSKQMIFQIGSTHIERSHIYFRKSSPFRLNQKESFLSDQKKITTISLLGKRPTIRNAFVYPSRQRHFESTEIDRFQGGLEPMPSFGLTKTIQRGPASDFLKFLPSSLKENAQNNFRYAVDLKKSLLAHRHNQKISRQLELFLFYDTHYMTPPITHRETIINNAKDKHMGHIYTPFLTCYFDFISFQGYAPITAFQFFSPGVGLIPFLEHDDGTRALMGANMQRQAVPLVSASRPIVGTGLEKNIAASFIISSSNSGYFYYISGKQSKQILKGFRSLRNISITTNDFKQFVSTMSKQLAKKSSISVFSKIQNTKAFSLGKFKNNEADVDFFRKTYLADRLSSSFYGLNSMGALSVIFKKLKCLPFVFSADRFPTKQIGPTFGRGGLKTQMFSDSPNLFVGSPIKSFSSINREYFKEGHHTILNTHWLPYRKSYKATIINKKPAIFENSWLQKGDLLVDGTSSINGELALGRNLFSIYMPWEGYNFEDAILISDKAAQGYTTIHVEEFSVKISKNEFVSSIVKPFTWVNLGDILVLKKRKLENEFIMNRLLFGMSSKPKTTNLDNNDLMVDSVSSYNFYGDKPLFDPSNVVNSGHRFKNNQIQIKQKQGLNNYSKHRAKFSKALTRWNQPTSLDNNENFFSRVTVDLGFHHIILHISFLLSQKKRRAASSMVNEPGEELDQSSKVGNQYFRIKQKTSLWNPRTCSWGPLKNRNFLNQTKMLRFYETKLKNNFKANFNFEKKVFSTTVSMLRNQLRFSIWEEDPFLKRVYLSAQKLWQFENQKLAYILKPSSLIQGRNKSRLVNNCSQLTSVFDKSYISGETSFITENRSINDNQTKQKTFGMLDDKQFLNEKDNRPTIPSEQQFFGSPVSMGTPPKKNDNFEIDTSYRTGESICGWVISVKSQSQLEQSHSTDSMETLSIPSSAEQSSGTNNETIPSSFAVFQPKVNKIGPASRPVVGIHIGSIQKFLNLLSRFQKRVQLKDNVFRNINEPWTECFNHKSKGTSYKTPNKFYRKLNPIGYLLLNTVFQTSPFAQESFLDSENRFSGSFLDSFQKGKGSFLDPTHLFSGSLKKLDHITLEWSVNNFETKQQESNSYREKIKSFKKSSFKSLLHINAESKLSLYNVKSSPIPTTERIPVIKTERVSDSITNNPRQRPGGDTIYIYVAVAKPLQVGDKMSGRHGNKGIISKVLPFYDMPYLIDGTPIDIVLNPLGVPSRMNVGQIYESLLGLAGFYKQEYYRIPPFDENYSSQFSRNFVYWKLHELKNLHFFTSNFFKKAVNTTTNRKINMTQLSPIQKRNSKVNILNSLFPVVRPGFLYKKNSPLGGFFEKFAGTPQSSQLNYLQSSAFKSTNDFKTHRRNVINTYVDTLTSRWQYFKAKSDSKFLIWNPSNRCSTINWNTALLSCPKSNIWQFSKNFSKPLSFKIFPNHHTGTDTNVLSFGKVFSWPTNSVSTRIEAKLWSPFSKPVINNLSLYLFGLSDVWYHGLAFPPSLSYRAALTKNQKVIQGPSKPGSFPIFGTLKRKNLVLKSTNKLVQTLTNTFFRNQNRPMVEKIGLNPYFPGKTRLLNGLTGETFYRPIIVGKSYMLKLIHLVHHKIHARATGPYALITQQPLKGKRNQGGQRMGEMEIWALYGFGSASILYEMLTIKSDDPVGRERILREIAGLKGNSFSNSNWKNENDMILSLRENSQVWKNEEFGFGSKINDSLEKGISESFRVLVMNLRALCLDMQVFKDLAN